MDKKIHPDISILEALFSESTAQTPFSRIPGFVKKFAITEDNKEKMISILSSIAEKELQHLETRIENIQNKKNIFDPELYNKILQIEGGKDSQGKNIHAKLIGLAKEIIASEMGLPVYTILKNLEAQLGTGIIDQSEFSNPHIDQSENFSEEESKIIQQEQQVRVIMNALIMGAGHRIFDKVETDKKYPKAINKIDPDLYQSYYDMVYANLKNMRETPPNNVAGNNTGSMQLINGENGAKIKIQADIFPVLLHEMAKGVVEYLAYTRYNNLNPEMVSSILTVDSRESEHWMMLVGPQMYKQLFFLIKESIAQYNEKNGILDDKKESDYIIPIFSHITQLPADQFLSFMEIILRQDQDGQKSIESITKIIDNIHNQYEGYLASSNAPKMKLTVKEIMEQLTRELNLGKKEQLYIKSALPDVQYRLESNGYSMSDKKLAKKIAEHYLGNREKFQGSDFVDQSWLTEVGDAIQGFKKSRIEKAAFSLVHEQQKKFPKWTKNHAGESINIHPRFPLTTLEEAKKNINPQIVQDIDNQINELIQKGSITEWLKDHDDMNNLNADLTERFITLDSVTPECIMQREGNRGLYELTTLEQLKRESGAMGSHCVADFIDSIKNGNLKVFSLRLGTKSRRTIGYQPGTQIINQVKGYTNQRKNSVLTLDDPDYQQVIEALTFLSQNLNVKQINDINVLYEKGFLLTNKGLLNSEQFTQNVKESGVYEITLLHGNKTMNLKDVDILEKLNLNNIEKIKYEVGAAVIVYSVSEKKIIGIQDNGIIQRQKDEIAKGIFALLELKKHEFFTNYDGYPVFLTDGIKKDDNYATVTRNGKFGIIKKTDDGYKEILPCIHDIAPWFTEMGQAIIKINGKFGILREEENDNRVTTIKCEYDEVPKFSIPGLMANEAVAKKDKKYGIIRENENKIFTEILPCIYDRIPSFGINGLEQDEARVKHDDTLPFGDTGTYGVIKRSGDGFEEILECKYDEIPNFGTDGLSPDEARTKRNGKYGILKKTGTKFEEVLLCEYDSKADNQVHGDETYGLIENEYLVYQNKKKGVIKKNNDNTWSEILPCEYDMISGTDFFDGNEIKVSRDKKHGFVKRENEKFIVILPCEYEEITEFGKTRLSPDETIVKKNGKYGIIRKNKENICLEILPCEYDSRPEFGDNILKDNEVIWADEGQFCVTRKLPIFGVQGIYSQAKVKFNGKPYIWKRNDDNTRDETIYEKYEEIKFKENGLQINEARVKKDKKWGIIRDNKDGTWMPIVQCKYNSVELGFSENTKLISIGDYGHTYGIIQRNDDGTWTEIVPCEYQEIQLGIKGLGSREMMVKDKIGSGKGIIKIDIDGKTKEIVPCQYDGITFGVDGLGSREAIVKRDLIGTKYGIIKINEDDTFTEILDCNYDNIKEVGLDYIIVKQDNRTSIIQKDTGTRFFSNAYDEILQFATGGLGKNEAVVRDDKKIVIIRKDKDGIDKKIISEYIMKDFGRYGLQDGEARAKKEGQGMGIVKRSKNESIKELLPCIYDAIGVFGDSTRGLQDSEVIVMKDGKCGIVKRVGDGYQEVLPCQYYTLGVFGENGLDTDEVWAQENKDGNYTIITKTENGYKETGFYSYIMRTFDFGKYGLLTNESFLSVYKGEGNGIIRKASDGTYDILFDDNHTFDLRGNREGLLSNEYRGTNTYGDEVIFYRKIDGSWESTEPYYQIFPLGQNGCNFNETIVKDGETYGIIKRNADGKREENLAVGKYYFDERCVFEEESPIVFFPDVLDGKRVVLAVQEYGEKVILWEDENGKFVDVGDTVQWLGQHPKFKEFFSDNLIYLPF